MSLTPPARRATRLDPQRSHETPVSLLERLRHPGDVAAWDRFVLLYTPFLHRCVRGLDLQEADRADLLQDVFLTLYRALPGFTYDRGGNFRSWLKAILMNRWRDAQRRRSPVPLDGVPEPAGGDDVAEFAEAEYRRRLVERALQLMKADFQPATWKACWESAVLGRPAAEVARELGMTPEAVYAASYRVLRRLRQELTGFLD
jgi:RNA polymerase sigma factor (sigma-70 family)